MTTRKKREIKQTQRNEQKHQTQKRREIYEKREAGRKGEMKENIQHSKKRVKKPWKTREKEA
jgi:hypothetical protein